MANHCLFLCLLLLAAATVAYGGSLGGWEPVSNHDPHVREVGEFAVRAYNEQGKIKGAGLKFESVLKAARQLVSGHNYRLVLAAEDGGALKTYMAVVYEKEQKDYKLTSFKPLLKSF
ncbi:hypothetical protein Tsubulata_018904 [Turnera subulata]|uniref:Cystatin domain-containing protein n=1 Tax=Turnera subulata TaxID=218843 RepID=A0A9Q0G024_9ROSI|nr:hypothetical protein Tsubulata_018904 [Turnera subulata]